MNFSISISYRLYLKSELLTYHHWKYNIMSHLAALPAVGAIGGVVIPTIVTLQTLNLI